MSQPARITPVLDDLQRQEKLYRQIGFHDIADRIAIRACDLVLETFQTPANHEAQITPVHRVGIYKGGL
jgi:hypothetical protein